MAGGRRALAGHDDPSGARLMGSRLTRPGWIVVGALVVMAVWSVATGT